MARTWARGDGFVAWLAAIEHQTIGRRYLVTAFVFLLLGGVEAALMRAQLARPETRLLGPDLYNQIFSMHGTTMMFLFAVPAMEGMGVFLVPLMIGTRNVAFPRLNAFGYWTYLVGAVFLYVGFLTNTGVDTGWFSYTPLSGPEFSPGKRVDFWAQMITFTELSGLVVAVELVVTILKQRAPGMSLRRMPLFVWAMLVQSFMVIFAMPAVMLASGLLLLDRTVGTHFFNPSEGGDPLLWQHLFWFFGHPEVYIIFIPALGMVSSIIVAFGRRPVVGYTAIVLSLVGTGFLAFGLWVHHMFATGLPQLGESFFTAASMTIAIPSGVQIFCWLATLSLATLRPRTPLLFVLGFVAIFLAGGLTGVMIASVPFDLQVHDSFFIVAHFHYTLIGGAVFPLLGGIYFWFPKMTGRLLSERLGRWNFWLAFIGFNLTFLPMHWLGLAGMPRRIYTYAADTGWGGLNALASGGAVLLVAAGVVFLANVVWSLRRGRWAGDDPWEADGLEWATPSPPPSYNFARLPTVRGLYPLWTRQPDDPVVVGLRTDRRELLLTTPLEAEPAYRYVLPEPTLWPFATSLAAGVGLIGSVFWPSAVYPGAALTTVALVGWFWPRAHREALA
ncbi:MAG TPA: cytochrome c oxidase subunit I [Candidatus Binatia bacterium]|nr:cytochrome c oxidase subunit I [Candidatus Binatia bacterium]